MIGKPTLEAKNRIEINGMAHVILSVSNWEQGKTFYEAFFPFLGLNHVFSGEDMLDYVGGRTTLGVSRCDKQ